MKILIATGLSKSDIGGPFQYAHNLEKEFASLGHEVRIVKYSSVERSILGVWKHLIWADCVLALDTFSVGFPTALLSKIFGKKIIIRVGGDFLWSAYVNRTGKLVTLPEFYKKLPKFSIKEKIIFFLSKWIMKNADVLTFNTEWQRYIWENFYEMKRSEVSRNFVPEKQEAVIAKEKTFLWAGRDIPEKNLEFLKKVARRVAERHPDFKLELVTGKPHEEVLEKIRECYAVVSLAISDVCPNFIIEGISFNKPFIMTKETGLSEIYPKGGVFVDPRDERGLESAIEAMLDFRVYNDSVEALRSNNFSHSWRELAQEFIEIWKKI